MCLPYYAEAKQSHNSDHLRPRLYPPQPAYSPQGSQAPCFAAAGSWLGFETPGIPTESSHNLEAFIFERVFPYLVLNSNYLNRNNGLLKPQYAK